jgi:hypothetical protein
MSLLDLEAFERTPLQRDPCDHVIVPRFVRPEALAAVNRDYPQIAEAGNFPPEALGYGPACDMLLKEIQAPEMRALFAAKFGVDLDPLRLEMTFRRFSDASDGSVHNDSRVKVVTALVYFNETWPHAGGRLRLVRGSRDVNDYAAEVEPAAGNLIAFRRSETSYHGFVPYAGERRSLQLYWVRPKDKKRGENRYGAWRRRLKRLLKKG